MPIGSHDPVSDANLIRLPTRWVRPPPAVVVGGRAVELKFAVRPALFESGATVRRVTADLSAFGGSSEHPMSPSTNGVYQLETSLDIDGRPTADISVLVEQVTSLGPYWSRILSEVTVAPETDHFIDRSGQSVWGLSAQRFDVLPPAPGSDLNPVWSPDGDRIAFFSLRDNDPEIYVMAADGSGAVNLNPETTIRFDLPSSGEAELSLFNLTGQRVAKLIRGFREMGSYTLRWDGTDDAGRALASGMYIYRLTAGDHVETRKLMLLR